MKFGEWLLSQRTAAWREYYIDYERLKVVIDELKAQKLGTTDRFLRTLQGEMRRADDFYRAAVTASLELSRRQLEHIRRMGNGSGAEPLSLGSGGGGGDMDASDDRGAAAQSTPFVLPPLRSGAVSSDVADVLAASLVELDRFAAINVCALQKIIKKHDKNVPNKPLSFHYESAVSRVGFCDVTALQPGYVLLSSAYGERRDAEREAHRRACAVEAGEDPDAAVGQDKPQETQGGDSFERQSVKFWVKPINMCKLLCFLMKHIPVFTFGAFGFGQDIESVYLDNASWELYERRVVKEEGAKLIRLRAYGAMHMAATVWVEQKCHHDSWTMDQSNKTRFSLPANKVLPYLQGAYRGDAALRERTPLLDEAQLLVSSKKLGPAIRTRCYRVAMQFPDDPNFRMSLDTGLSMLRERAVPGLEFFTPPDRLLDADCTHCPLGVLEVKIALSGSQQLPAWYTQLLNMSLIIRCDKFSKYCHGVAKIYPEQITQVPWWMKEYDELVAQVSRYGGDEDVLQLSAPARSASASPASELKLKASSQPTPGPADACASTQAPLSSAAASSSSSPSTSPPVPAGAHTVSVHIDASDDHDAGAELRHRAGATAAAARERPSIQLAAIKLSGSASDAPPQPPSGSGSGAIASPLKSVSASASPPPAYQLSTPKETSPASGSTSTRLWSWLSGVRHGGTGVVGGGALGRVHTRIKVDPKTLFANERTFLKWLHVSIWMVTLGAAISTLPDAISRLGYLMVATGLLTVLYACVTYHRRVYCLRHRADSDAFVDLLGPTVLTAVVVTGCCVGIIFSVSKKYTIT